MTVRLFALAWLFAAGFVPCVFAAGPVGAPDPDAFRHWHITLPSAPTDSDRAAWSLAYGQGKLLGAGTRLRYSTDGFQWVDTGWGTESGFPYRHATHAEGLFVAVGRAFWSIVTSTNALNWRGQYPSGLIDFRGVAYGNGVFVAGGVGSTNTFVIATNPSSPSLWWGPGQFWWPVPRSEPFDCFGLFFGAGKFVATGPGSSIAVSTNGWDWVVTRQAVTGLGFLQRGTWHNGRYIVVGAGGLILVSEDAVKWTQRPTPTTRALRGVAAHNNQYVAVGDQVMLISTNGLDWEEIPLIEPDSYFLDIIVADNTFAALYHDSGLFTAVYRSDPFHYTAPSFLTEPIHIEQRLGLATSFTAIAHGTAPVTYQWQRNSVDIAGATSNQLAFAKLERGDDATYRVIARNDVGEATSAEAKLTVGLPVSVLVSPVSQSVPSGGSVTFSVEVEGKLPITNKWRKPGSIFVTQILNQATAFLRVENVQAADAGIYGASLENKYGFTATRPATLTVLIDADADGLPDDWEQQHGLAESGDDFDRDGVTNLQEYQAGTDPKDPQSYLKVERFESAAGSAAVILNFLARSNRTYSVESREHLGAGTWQRFLDVVASASDRVVTVTNAVDENESYFRLVTPRVE